MDLKEISPVHTPSPAIGDLFVVHSNLRIFAALKQNQFYYKKKFNKSSNFNIFENFIVQFFTADAIGVSKKWKKNMKTMPQKLLKIGS